MKCRYTTSALLSLSCDLVLIAWLQCHLQLPCSHGIVKCPSDAQFRILAEVVGYLGTFCLLFYEYLIVTLSPPTGVRKESLKIPTAKLLYNINYICWLYKKIEMNRIMVPMNPSDLISSFEYSNKGIKTSKGRSWWVWQQLSPQLLSEACGHLVFANKQNCLLSHIDMPKPPPPVKGVRHCFLLV